MKKNKVLKIVLIVLGALVALLAAAVLGVLFYLHSMAAGIPETLPDAPADSTQVTLTDDEIDKLLSGEITLEELADEAAASGSGEQEHPPALRSRRQVRFPPRQVLLLLRGALPPGRRAAVQRPPASRRLPVQPIPVQKNRRPPPANRRPATRPRSRHCCGSCTASRHAPRQS